MTNLSELHIDTILPELKKTMRQENINLYAKASGDNNPIHLDPEFGKKMQLGGTVAHGMMILAYVSEYMTANFGKSWLTTGKLNIRFKDPAKPGDSITVFGRVTQISDDGNQSKVNCEIICQNQNNQPIIIGDTEVRVDK